MRHEKRLRPLMILLLLFVASLLFYLWGNPAGRTFKSLETQSISEQVKLTNVLRRASMEDRTVIVTIVNQTYAAPGSILDLFLESFQIGEETNGFLNHLLIIASDHEALDRCKVIHPYCYLLTTNKADSSADKQSISIDHLKLAWKKIEILQTILELGYSFIFTDADVMWFRDPMQHFRRDIEIHIDSDYYRGNPTEGRSNTNGGFSYVKSNAIAIEFFKYWQMSRVLYPGYSDQSVFQIIKDDVVSQMIGLRMLYLDTSYFGGFCEPSEDMNEVCTMHANCCVGTERKLHDLKLVLEDWRNFTKLSTEGVKLRASSSLTSPWRAPSSCKS